jgi:uncharacterized protein
MTAVAPAGSPGWTREYEAILAAYQQAGGDPTVLRSARAAAVVASGDAVLTATEVEGVHLDVTGTRDAIDVVIAIDPGTRPDAPVHLCFGVLPADGTQHIHARIRVGDGADVAFLAHCSFPNARHVEHVMEARIQVGPGAHVVYDEGHYHGPHGGALVRPTTLLHVARDGRFISSFRILHGRVGRLDLRLEATVDDDGLAEMTTKAYGTGNDRLRVGEVFRLVGRNARSLSRTRIAVRDDATSEVDTRTEGAAPGARGHMDCAEIIRDRATATNTPVVVVQHEGAQVTHEAAIGRVDQRQLETLMARGLDEDEATDVIIRGLLR